MAKITKNSILGLIVLGLKNYLVGTAFARKVLERANKRKKMERPSYCMMYLEGMGAKSTCGSQAPTQAVGWGLCKKSYTTPMRQ